MISAGGLGSSPISDIIVTDLPDPLSPTTPSSSPGAIAKLTPLTAWTAPSRVANTVRRSLTSRTGAGPSSIGRAPCGIGFARRLLSGMPDPRAHSVTKQQVLVCDNRELPLDAAPGPRRLSAHHREGTIMPTGLTPRELLARLVAFPTVSSQSNLDLIGFVEDYLAGFGVASLRLPDADRRQGIARRPDRPRGRRRRRALRPHRRGAGRGPGLDLRPLDARPSATAGCTAAAPAT